MASSVIFIGSPELPSKRSWQLKTYTALFLVRPKDLGFRIFASFIPPFTLKYRKIYVDLLGPILAFFSLLFLLIYGYTFKKYKLGVTPAESMLIYAACMPIFCFLLAKLGKSTINFYETLSLVGYSLYGHLFTLLTSFIFFHEKSNTFFFMALILLGGASSLRLILVFLKTIPVPAARLLVCSSISAANILFLIYLHFAFMHVHFY